MSQETADLQALLDWAAGVDKQASAVDSAMPNLDHGRPVETGSRYSENTADLSRYPGGGIDHAAAQSAAGTDPHRRSLFGENLKQLDASDPPAGIDPAKTVTYKGDGDTAGEKEAADLAALLAEAAQLDRLVAEAAQPAKAAADAPGGAATPAQPDAESQRLLALAQAYKQAGEVRAEYLVAYQHGFTDTWQKLAAALADGSLAKWADAADGDPDPDEDDDDAPAKKPATDAGGGDTPAPTPPPATDAGAPAGGPPPMAGGPGMDAGGGDPVEEIAHALIGAGMPPEHVEALLQELLSGAGGGGAPMGGPEGAPAGGLPPEKMAQVQKAAGAVKAAGAYIRQHPDFEYRAPANDKSATFRRNVRAYIREALSAGRR